MENMMQIFIHGLCTNPQFDLSLEVPDDVKEHTSADMSSLLPYCTYDGVEFYKTHEFGFIIRTSWELSDDGMYLTTKHELVAKDNIPVVVHENITHEDFSGSGEVETMVEEIVMSEVKEVVRHWRV